ncbi:hypothetical protein C6N75_06030 [Streptomyces solincola]|uniref:DUF3618 domain-containing protein n=1 Tax=Streptomyces solincola TaxID=2100817 RepID=A0A2S9Q084_9ACTN|nr:DUF3618 domain-containing protein [Streptomyces solincola]PRH80090.1 hypothetical protein C6N75_06030 [Streptomyces solincola]
MSDSAKSPGPDQLRLEAAQKRAELGETIDQLMAKTDVKARAAHLVHEKAHLVHEKAPQPVREHPGPVLAAAAAAVALVTGLVVWGIKRSGNGGGRVRAKHVTPKYAKPKRKYVKQVERATHGTCGSHGKWG